VDTPSLNGVAAELYPPPDKTTLPVGVGLPLGPATVTVAVNESSVVIVWLERAGLMLGVKRPVKVIVAEPEEP